jgi:hypothetical protein
MCSLDFHSTYKNIICCSLKCSGLWPYADDKRISNDLVDAVLWQCMFALSMCLLQSLGFLLEPIEISVNTYR